MKSILAITLMVALATASFGVNQAFASSWKQNPLNDLDINKRVNTSDHVSEKKKFSPKSYSFKTSKVCGLELCKSEQKPHLQNVWAGGLNAQYSKDFDGKATIKGHFLRK